MESPDRSNFYIIDETATDYPRESTAPIGFEEAVSRAETLLRAGHRVQVLYTEEASMDQIRTFTNKGILAELASTA